MDGRMVMMSDNQMNNNSEDDGGWLDDRMDGDNDE